jgi:hypothetical protein
MLKRPARQVRRWAWWANLLSYALVFASSVPHFYHDLPTVNLQVFTAACLDNVRQINVAIEEYRGAHGGRLPQAADFADRVRTGRSLLAALRT